MILEQWLSALQLLPKDLRKGLMGQVSRPTIYPTHGGWRWKQKKSIKEEGSDERGDWKIVRESIVESWTISVTFSINIY